MGLDSRTLLRHSRTLLRRDFAAFQSLETVTGDEATDRAALRGSLTP